MGRYPLRALAKHHKLVVDGEQVVHKAVTSHVLDMNMFSKWLHI